MDPIKALNSTVLPAPLGPIIASDVPRGTPKLRSRITSVVPNRTVRCSTSNALVIPQPYQSAACGGITHSNPGLSVLVSGHNRWANYNRIISGCREKELQQCDSTHSCSLRSWPPRSLLLTRLRRKVRKVRKARKVPQSPAKSNGPVVARGAFYRRDGSQNRRPCERGDAIPASDARGAAEGRSAQVEAGRHAPCVRDRQARQPDFRGRGRFIRAQSGFVARDSGRAAGSDGRRDRHYQPGREGRSRMAGRDAQAQHTEL